MPWYRINGQLVHMRGTKLPKPCHAIVQIDGRQQRCMAISSYECDWPMAGGHTCDEALCQDHATEIGPNRHYCPAHFADLRADRRRSLFTSLPGVKP